MNEFATAALEGMAGNVLGWPIITWLVLRLSLRQAVGGTLMDARQLRSIYREYEPASMTPVASAMTDGLVAQLQVAAKDLHGHIGLITCLGKSRDLVRMCTTAAWGIKLSQQGPAMKAEGHCCIDPKASSPRLKAAMQAPQSPWRAMTNRAFEPGRGASGRAGETSSSRPIAQCNSALHLQGVRGAPGPTGVV